MLISSTKGLTKTLAKIRNIRNAPEELLALTNEVSDLRIIFSDVQGYIHSTRRSPGTPRLAIIQEEVQHMAILVNRAKDKLLELDQLIQYRLTKPESIEGHIKVSRRGWARAKNTIEGFRQSLRDIRLNIVTQMVVINSYILSLSLEFKILYTKPIQFPPVPHWPDDRRDSHDFGSNTIEPIPC